jgi:hypothetical protein
VQRQSQQNRVACHGVAKFSQSINFLSEKLAKGPTSESGIKKLELGLTTQVAAAPVTSSSFSAPPQQQAQAPPQKQGETPSVSSSSGASAAPSLTTDLRDGLFKTGELLSDIASLLERIEAQQTRLNVGRKRREMLAAQRERLTAVAAARKVSLNALPQQQQQAAGGGARVAARDTTSVAQATAMMLHQ